MLFTSKGDRGYFHPAGVVKVAERFGGGCAQSLSRPNRPTDRQSWAIASIFSSSVVSPEQLPLPVQRHTLFHTPGREKLMFKQQR